MAVALCGDVVAQRDNVIMRTQELEVLFEPEMVYMQTPGIVRASGRAFGYTVIAEKSDALAVVPARKRS